jgi:enoyl-CoA hydratase/carnithine racemase
MALFGWLPSRKTDAKMSELSSGVLDRSVLGSVLHLRLNRPESKNAINHELHEALGLALAEFNDDDSLLVAVISGAGDGFSAGQDLQALSRGETIFPPDHPEWGFAGIARQRIDKPIIAAVHGFAIGGGLEIALACDLLVSHDTARFGLPEVTVGLFAAGGGVTRLAQQVPPKVAMAMALTGEALTGERAHHFGLVSHLVAQEEVVDRALELAATISSMAPLGVAATKKLMDTLPYAPASSEAGWAGWEDHYRRVFFSDDAKEGVQAFLDKRPPKWSGR